MKKTFLGWFRYHKEKKDLKKQVSALNNKVFDMLIELLKTDPEDKLYSQRSEAYEAFHEAAEKQIAKLYADFSNNYSHYIPKEQCEWEGISHMVDGCMLGVALYTIVTGIRSLNYGNVPLAAGCLILGCIEAYVAFAGKEIPNAAE